LDEVYIGPGLYGSQKEAPALQKRSAFPKDHIGFVNSSAKINFPKEVYARCFASSVSFISIYNFYLI